MSKTRSIWESRFYALKSTIEYEKNRIESMAGDVLLEDANYNHDELKARHDTAKRIWKRACQIEKHPERFLYTPNR